MSFIQLAIICLAIAASVGVIIGYLIGLWRGIRDGFTDGFEYGTNEAILRTLEMMDRNGLFVSYCDALKNEARRSGMTDEQIKEILAEQDKALAKIRGYK